MLSFGFEEDISDSDSDGERFDPSRYVRQTPSPPTFEILFKIIL